MNQAVRVDWRDLKEKVREHYGFRQFRPGQQRAVQAAMQGRDTIVIMPTGSGKSLCFQLPALALKGTTLVVSPLIALMKDQTDALVERGISAIAVHSALTAGEVIGAVDLTARVSVSPEARGKCSLSTVWPGSLLLKVFSAGAPNCSHSVMRQATPMIQVNRVIQRCR